MAGIAIMIGTVVYKKMTTSPSIPANALLNEDGTPLLNEDGSYILKED